MGGFLFVDGGVYEGRYTERVKGFAQEHIVRQVCGTDSSHGRSDRAAQYDINS